MTTRNQPPTLSNYRPSHDHAGQRQGHPPRQQEPAMRVRRRPPGPVQRRTSSLGLGSILVYGLIAIVAVIGAGLILLMIAPPTDLIRSQLVSVVKSKTGRDLAIRGPTSFTFYPAIGVTMSKVSLSAPPGMSAPPTVQMDRLLVSVKLLPLLSQQVAVNQLILTNPVFDLRVDAGGRKSWDFAGSGVARPVRVAQAQTDTSNDASDLPPEALDFMKNATDQKPTPDAANRKSSGGTSVAALKELTLDDVRIVNGTLVYTDETAKSQEEVRPLNVKLSLKSLSRPLSASGDIGWKGEKVGFDATLTTPKAILAEQPAKLIAKIDARPVRAQYDGLIDLAGGLTLDGALAANSQSVRALAGWLGTNLPPSRGFGPLDLTGRIKAEGSTYSFLNANAKLDGAKAAGDIVVKTAGKRPHVNATLQLSQLNLNTYLGEAAAGGAVSGDAGGGEGGGADPGTRVQGYTERAGWSDERIDFSGLGAVDANAKLTVGSLLYKKIHVDQSVIKVALKDKKMRADLTDMALYEGRGRGVVTLDATAKAAGLGANFAIDGVSAQPLLRDASDIEWLAGRGKLNLAIASRGQTERQMVETLTGNASFNFTDGAIIGLNIPQMIRGFSQGQLNQADQSNSQKTDFSELSATFKIQQGVAQNDDLIMLSPLLRLTGNGQIMLPPRQVDYMLRPKIVSSLEGQGGDAGLGGVEIPVRVTGSFENIKYTPDLGGVLQDPNKAVDVIKQIGDKFKGKKAGEIIDDLFGGGDSSAEADGQAAPEGGEKKKIDAKKLLEGLFGGQ